MSIFCLHLEVAIFQGRNLIAKHGPTPWTNEHAGWSLMSSLVVASPKSWYTWSKFMDKTKVWKKPLGLRCGIFTVSSINPFISPISMKCLLFLSVASNFVDHFCARSHKGSISKVLWDLLTQPCAVVSIFKNCIKGIGVW